MGGGIFQEIVLTWKGTTFKIAPTQVMRAIAVAEDHITLGELSAGAANPGTVKFTKLAAAYGAVLRYAGAPVTDEQVYEGLFGAEDGKRGALSAIVGLLQMMVPESVAKNAEAEVAARIAANQAAVKNQNRRERRKTAAVSSKATTRRSSATES